MRSPATSYTRSWAASRLLAEQLAGVRRPVVVVAHAPHDLRADPLRERLDQLAQPPVRRGVADVGEVAGEDQRLRRWVDPGDAVERGGEPRDGVDRVVLPGLPGQQVGVAEVGDDVGRRRQLAVLDHAGERTAAPSRSRQGAGGLDPAGHLAEGDPAAGGAGRGVAQHHLVAVLEERAAAARTAPCRPSSARGTSPRVPGSGPLMVPEAKRSPVRVLAPLTVRWASIWAGDQYIVRYGGRLTTSPFSTTSTSMSSARRRRSSRRDQVLQRRRVLRRQVAPGRVQRRERGDPGADRRRERLAEERPERDVLPGLDVARAPVVEPDDAEDVLARSSSTPIRLPSSDPTPTTKPSSASMSSRRLGPYVGASSCGALRCPHGPDDRRTADDDAAAAAVVADRAGAASWAAAAPGRVGRSGRRWRRGRARRRSRRSRRPRTAGAASTSSRGSPAAPRTRPARRSAARVSAHASGPSAMKSFRVGRSS